jgi:hypothetical protein
MKRVIMVFTILIAISCGNQPNSKQPIKEVQATSAYSWMLGNWVINYGETKVYENWRQENETMLIGSGFVVKGADTIVREDMRMQYIGNKWVFIAKINENNPILFTCNQDSAGVKLVFENPEHDYPQRITYGLNSAKEIYALVEGLDQGKANREEYYFKRF